MYNAHLEEDILFYIRANDDARSRLRASIFEALKEAKLNETLAGATNVSTLSRIAHTNSLTSFR
jgi:hypothetical protein